MEGRDCIGCGGRGSNGGSAVAGFVNVLLGEVGDVGATAEAGCVGIAARYCRGATGPLERGAVRAADDAWIGAGQ